MNHLETVLDKKNSEIADMLLHEGSVKAPVPFYWLEFISEWTHIFVAETR
jgi:hypothetical protein